MSSIVSNSNAGAHYLASGDYDSAIRHLTTAFEQSRDEVLKEASRRKVTSDDHISKNVESHQAYRTCGGIVDAWMIEAPEEADLHRHYVYSSPIFIPTNARCNDSVIFSVVVSFNLGLAFLEAASREGGNWMHTSARLRQALKLFQYSFRLQRARGKASQSPLFFMATVNNIGVLYSTLGEPSHANECFQQLLALVMYLNTNGAEGVALSYGAFLQNTSRIALGGDCLSCCEGAAARAA